MSGRAIKLSDLKAARDAITIPGEPDDIDPDPDNIPLRAGAASFVGMTPREIREQQSEADAIEDHLRSQAVVDRARAEHDAVPEVQLEDTEPQS